MDDQETIGEGGLPKNSPTMSQTYITICIKTPVDTKKVQLAQESSLFELRQIIAQDLNLSQEDVCLLRMGQILQDGGSLSDCDISDSSTITVVSKSGQITRGKVKQGDYIHPQAKSGGPDMGVSEWNTEMSSDKLSHEGQNLGDIQENNIEHSHLMEMEQKLANLLEEASAESEPSEQEKTKLSMIETLILRHDANNINSSATRKDERVASETVVAKLLADSELVHKIMQAPNTHAATEALRKYIMEQAPITASIPEEILNDITVQLLLCIMDDQVDAQPKIRFDATHAVWKIQKGIHSLTELDRDFPDILRKLGIPQLSGYIPFLPVLVTPDFDIDVDMQSDGDTDDSGDNDAPTEYSAQLEQIEKMGFIDKAANLKALAATSGNIEAAVDKLLELT